MPDVRILGVELVGEFAPDGFGGAEQFAPVAFAVLGDDAFSAQEEDKAFEQGGVGCRPGGLEAFIGVLRGAFVIEARFPHGGDDDPVAREIDGVAIGLVHGGHAPARKGAVQRIAGALAFEDGDELFLALLEPAQHGIGDLAVHLDVAFSGKGEGVRRFGRAGIAEQAAKNVGEEIRQQGGFLEFVRAARRDEAGPVLEFGQPVPRALRQAERAHLLAEDLRVEERFGFEGHLFSGRLWATAQKAERIGGPGRSGPGFFHGR